MIGFGFGGRDGSLSIVVVVAMMTAVRIVLLGCQLVHALLESQNFVETLLLEFGAAVIALAAAAARRRASSGMTQPIVVVRSLLAVLRRR